MTNISASSPGLFIGCEATLVQYFLHEICFLVCNSKKLTGVQNSNFYARCKKAKKACKETSKIPKHFKKI